MASFSEHVPLSKSQLRAYETIQAGHNVVIMGQAGTGKSVLVASAARMLRALGRTVSVTASTGIAASRYGGGETLHHWSGIQDGRFTNFQVTHRLLTSQSEEERVSKIREADILFIDEISMISARIFEQVEHICRCLRDPKSLFGGLQVVCVGDFFQLPPIPSDLYKDPGKHVFNSSVWQAFMKHKILLSKVMRQTDPILIEAIKELEMGTPSDITNDLMLSLSRRLNNQHDQEKTVFLYGTNIEVEWHNSLALTSMPGEMHTYASEDTGDPKKVCKITAPRLLCLKTGCSIMLLKNITNRLVNGLIGEVISLEKTGPVVHFPSVDLTLRTEKTLFSVFDPQKNENVATRFQFPLKLSYALTVHKAQGQTFQSVEVNCKHIQQPGQLGVAVGRAVSREGLRVVDYSPKCYRSHPPEVTVYTYEPGLYVGEDNTCCKKIMVNLEENVEETFEIDPSDESEFEEEELQHIDHMMLSDENSSDEVYEHTMVEEDIVNLIKSLHEDNPITEQQKSVNSALDRLLMQKNKLTVFCNSQYDTIKSLINQSTNQSTSITDWNKFYASFHAHLSSPQYMDACKMLFTVTRQNKLVSGQLIMRIRKMAIESITERQQEDPVKNVQLSIYDHGKIRYLGGRAIAKVKYHYMNLVKSDMAAHGMMLDAIAKLKVELLYSLTESQATVLQTSKYPESLKETFQKQNLNFGLTNISDNVFEFFLKLEKKRIPLYNNESLRIHRSNVLNHAKMVLLSDTELFSEWACLFRNSSLHTSLVSTAEDETDEIEQIKDVIDDLVVATESVLSLHEDVLRCYLQVSDNQFRKDLLASFGRKKTMEHRKKVIQKSAKEKDLFSVNSISADSSLNKLSTHLKLKSKDCEKMLQQLTKNNLQRLGRAYALKLPMKIKKQEMIDKLQSQITISDSMPYPHEFDEQSTSSAGNN